MSEVRVLADAPWLTSGPAARVLAHFSGAPPESTYVPAHIENGKFVPGTEIHGTEKSGAAK